MLKKPPNTSFYLVFHLLRVIRQLRAKLEIFHKNRSLNNVHLEVSKTISHSVNFKVLY